ncbi:MAG: hypothetical protein IV103_05120 [Zoogloea sp.]|nr:hypothetical protein [Zoogloea sp.]
MKPDRPILTIDGTKDGTFYSVKNLININQLLNISIQVLSGDQGTVSGSIKPYQKHTKKPAIAGFFVFGAYRRASGDTPQSHRLWGYIWGLS